MSQLFREDTSPETLLAILRDMKNLSIVLGSARGRSRMTQNRTISHTLGNTFSLERVRL